MAIPITTTFPGFIMFTLAWTALMTAGGLTPILGVWVFAAIFALPAYDAIHAEIEYRRERRNFDVETILRRD